MIMNEIFFLLSHKPITLSHSILSVRYLSVRVSLKSNINEKVEQHIKKTPQVQCFNVLC